MRIRNRHSFSTITTEGSILPADLLERIADLTTTIEGRTPDGYHLIAGEKLNEAVTNSWNRALAAWRAFSAARDHLGASDTGTTITRERWLLPLFNEMQWGRLTGWKAIEIAGRSFPISHGKDHVPIHLVGCGVELDTRSARVAGASRTSPHGLVQELLNASDDYLWGIVSNGLKLRILRDNSSLTRQAFVEFDLEAMMNGEIYADFAVFWLLCHFSGFEGTRPEECRIEKWSRLAVDEGTRALDQLRIGVETTIEALGRGFLKHPANAKLRDRLHSGALSTQDYYRQVLRLVYRLLFLFVAEDRALLNLPEQSSAAMPDSVNTAGVGTASRSTTTSPRERYMRFYSASRLRELAARRQGTRHTDLYTGLRLIMDMLGKGGCPDLALPELGSFLWSREAISEIVDCEIENYDLLDSIRELAYTRAGDMRRRISYKNLGTEELGSVYESLLERHPQINVVERTFSLATSGGNERKTSGSYYTPSSLVSCLLDTALDPVLDEAAKKPNAAQAILALKVCDPACGSGHFLIAAAHRIAKRLATVRTGNDEPSPGDIRHALREVIGHCIYGVDINPMSVELCKVALWMEALEPGKPLSFLDHHIQCGNSLLGTTPALLASGIPDEAFTPIEGDDKRVCAAYKKRNKEERKNAGQLTLNLPAWNQLGNLPAAMVQLESSPDDTADDVHQLEQRYADIVESSAYLNARFLADLWCSAFVWRKADTEDGSPPYIPTEKTFRDIQKNPHSAPQTIRQETMRLQAQYQFFHWHLAFPTVFSLPAKDEKPDNEQMGWTGGFDCVLGNPPWEKIHFRTEEHFANIAPEIAEARTKDQRSQLIKALSNEAASDFTTAKELHDRVSSFLRSSTLYRLTGISRINLYSVFVELALSRISFTGRTGLIVPSGIITDDNNKHLFRNIIALSKLVSVYELENKKLLFSEVDSRYRFCLVTIGHSITKPASPDLAFGLLDVTDLADADKHFTLGLPELEMVSPITFTCPVFRTERDARLIYEIYRRGRAWCLINPSQGWPGIPKTPFNMSNDSRHFVELNSQHNRADVSGLVPLYEAKLVHQFNHRFASFAPNGSASEDSTQLQTSDDLADPEHTIVFRYHLRLELLRTRSKANWFVAYREITNATNERTSIASILPLAACGHSLVVVDHLSANCALYLVANLNAFCFDYAARNKITGLHLNLSVWKQLPIIDISQNYGAQNSELNLSIFRACIELIYTAHDLTPFAQDCGYGGPLFIWDDDRRFLLRCELDAAYFHLYGIERDDVDYIMETFPIVKRKDEKAHGEYRTKRVILEMYDQMAEATATGVPYQTWLDPPPANGWTPPAELIEEALSTASSTPVDVEPHLDIPETDITQDEDDDKTLTLFDVPPTVTFKTAQPGSTKKTLKANPYFRRSVLAAEIIDKLHTERNFGHVKFQKVFEICELDSDIQDLETQYYRQAAGPYDPHAFRSIHSQLKKSQWFAEERRQNGYGFEYIRLAKAGGHSKYYPSYFSDKDSNIQRIIQLFRQPDTEQCSIIGTLYTAWNDLILNGNLSPTENEIIRDASTEWHKSKEIISHNQWLWGLNWMRQHQLTPRGTGKLTKKSRHT